MERAQGPGAMGALREPGYEEPGNALERSAEKWTG